MDSGAKTELMTIPAGQFFLLRSSKSPKATIECLYNDATLAIRESSAHVYKLVVRKEMDESESTGGDENEDFDDEEISILSGQSKKDEEWSFTLDESLHFHKNWNKQGDMTFVWRNTKGDRGEKFQFVVNNDIPLTDIDQFLQAVYRCEYEYKYKRSSNGATEEELKQFAFAHSLEDPNIFSDEDDVEETNSLVEKLKTLTIENESSGDEESDDDSQLYEDAHEEVTETQRRRLSELSLEKRAIKGQKICLLMADLHLYDPIQESFILQEESVEVSIVNLGSFDYWLSVQGKIITLGKDVSPDMHPNFDIPNKMFIFDYDFEGVILSYMLQFSGSGPYASFQSNWFKSIWEFSNKKEWISIPKSEQERILNTSAKINQKTFGSSDFNSKGLEHIFSGDGDYDNDSDNNDDGDDNDGEDSHDDVKACRQTITKLHYGTSEKEDLIKKSYQNSAVPTGNKSLSIGFKNDRSYVVRGNKIGVFKPSEDGVLEFVTAITKISNLKGKLFDPENPMLYLEDRAMIIQDNADKSKLYRIDLERGQVVEEWSMYDKYVVQYGPSRKFDQLTTEKTFLGISDNSVFKIDPRLAGPDKIVWEEHKEYVKKYSFCSLATTENGYIAVGSERGGIRLYDRLGIKATLLPPLGEPIRHMCLSRNGRWLLATCHNSLLLIDLIIREGRNSGSIGFLKPFPRDETPKVYTLRINPEHVSYMQTTIGDRINFKKSYFNMGLDQQEKTIITSTGPFAIMWSLKQIFKGKTTSYLLKRYDSEIVEDNFRFGTDGHVIVVLKDDVVTTEKKSFKIPTKEVLIDEPLLDRYFDHDDAEVVKKWE